MCEKAVEIADARNQDLAICIVSDHDPKGRDMRQSASRKIEVMAALSGVEAEVTQAAVTKQQVEEFGIPGDPAKVPDGLDNDVDGAKGYETQKEIFREYAGQYPVEIQAFSTRYPDAFEAEIESVVQQYFDADLDERIQDNAREAREQARRALVGAFEDRRDEIAEALAELQAALDEYRGELESNVEAATQGLSMLRDEEHYVREAVGLADRRDELGERIKAVDYKAVVSEIDVEIPDPVAAGVDDPVLDTRRSFMEQLTAYRQHNMRYADE